MQGIMGLPPFASPEGPPVDGASTTIESGEHDTAGLFDAPDASRQNRRDSMTFYRDVLERLAHARIACLIGGAYGLRFHTGIERDTKDFDVFLRRRDVGRALDALASAGFRTELTHPHFLGKAFFGDRFVDLIFSSGNGVSLVDDQWFRCAQDAELLGIPVKFCAIEDMIWSKAFIMERERFDGADVAHLLRAGADRLDWSRLIARFDRHWHVLLAHLILFEFIFPGDRGRIPRHIIDKLLERLRDDRDVTTVDPDLCRGTLLSRQQYLYDLQRLGMKDARLQPIGNMTADEIARWTAAIEEPR